LLLKLKEIIPSAFYTVEKVNRAAESLADAPTPEQKNYWNWLKRSSA
jgi:hypothetical protein